MVDSEGDGSVQERAAARLARRRERNRLHQAKYRRDAQEAQLNAEQLVDTLSQQIEAVQLEHSGLVDRERQMCELLKAHESHMSALHNNQRVWQAEQDNLLTKVVLALSEVHERAITTLEAKQWTLAQWVQHYHEELLDHLARLWEAAVHNTNGPEHAKLCHMVMILRNNAIEQSMRSGLNLALLAWNLEHTSGMPVAQQPTEAHWAIALDNLKLSSSQVQEILQARASFLTRLQAAQEARRAAYANLHAAELLAAGQEVLHAGQDLAEGNSLPAQMWKGAIRQLHSALRVERRSIEFYLDTIQIEILTPLQEVWLDAKSPTRPWWPDWWVMGNLLAASNGHPQAPDFSILLQKPPTQHTVLSMPLFTPLQLLLQPLTVMGGGNHMKRSLLTCVSLTVERVSPYRYGALYQLPDAQFLQKMTMFEAMLGTFKDDWQQHDIEQHRVPRT